MKIVCTAFVLMLMLGYGCTADELAADASRAEIVAADADADQSRDEAVDALESHDVEEVSPVSDVSSPADANMSFDEDVFITLEQDAEGLESDPTSFHSPSFRYVPHTPFEGR